MEYLIICIFLLFCVWECDIHHRIKLSKLYFFIAFFSFFLLSGLRYKIGGDTLNYMDGWDLYPDLLNFNWAEDIEEFQSYGLNARYQPGWILYAMIVRAINPDFVAIQLVSSFLLNLAIFRTIKKYSESPFLSILIYFLTFSFYKLEFEALRESVAVAIFLLFAFDNWMKKKWLRYYIFTTLSFFIHPSSAVMFILPVFRYLKWDNLKYILFIIVPALIIGIAGRIFLGNLIENLVTFDSIVHSYQDKAMNVGYNLNYLVTTLYTPALLLFIILIGKRYVVTDFLPLVYVAIGLMIMALFYFDCVRFANCIIIPVYIAITPIIKHMIHATKTVWIAVVFMLVYSLPDIYVVKSGGEISTSRYFPYQSVIYHNQTPAQKKYWN